MSQGSRIISRGKAAISNGARFASTPKEPLHFLYPRCFATVAAGTPDRDRHAPTENNQNELLKETSTRQFGKQSPELASDSAAQPKDDNLDSTIDAEKSSQYARHVPSVPSNHQQPSTKLVPGIQSSLHYHRSAGGLHKNAEYRAIQKAIRLASAKVYHQEKLGESGVIPDWRKVLQDLVQNTPKQTTIWHDNGLRILIPDIAVGTLLYSANNNIWKIKNRWSCDIELLEASHKINGHRVLLLSGPATGIRDATMEILRIAGGALACKEDLPTTDYGFNTSSARRDEDDDNSQFRLRRVWSQKFDSMRRPKNAGDVERPRVWTKENLEEYIMHITSIQMSSHMESELYGENTTHQATVQDILVSTFLDDSSMAAMTPATLNIALAWLAARNQIRSVRISFVRADMQETLVDTESFNIMLRAAAKHVDLRTFGFLLRMMNERDIRPNSGTWLAFYRCVEDATIKRYILEGMRKKGLLLDPMTIRAVCSELAPHEVRWSIAQNHSHQQFLHHMDERYGFHWMSVECCNIILRELGNRHSSLSKVWEFFESMKTRNVKPDSVTINTILTACRDRQSIGDAILLISKAVALNSWSPDQDTYELLFFFARSLKTLPNVESVIWRYACLYDMSTHLVRVEVREAMSRIVQDWHITSAEDLAEFLGMPQCSRDIRAFPQTQRLEKAAEGLGNGNSTHTVTPRLSNKRRRKIVEKNGNVSNRRRRKMVDETLEKQLRVSYTWRARITLDEALLLALSKDRENVAKGSQPPPLFLQSSEMLPIRVEEHGVSGTWGRIKPLSECA